MRRDNSIVNDTDGTSIYNVCNLARQYISDGMGDDLCFLRVRAGDSDASRKAGPYFSFPESAPS